MQENKVLFKGNLPYDRTGKMESFKPYLSRANALIIAFRHKGVRYPKTARVTYVATHTHARTISPRSGVVRSKRSTMVHRVSRLGNTLELKSVLARVRSLGST